MLSENGTVHRAWHRLSGTLLSEDWCHYCPQRGRVGEALDLVTVQGVSLGSASLLALPRLPWLAVGHPAELAIHWSGASSQSAVLMCREPGPKRLQSTWPRFVLINQVRIAGCCSGAGE